MGSRFNVDVNNFSTPFSTQVNTIAARNEERRLERIYGGSAQPQKTDLEESKERARAYDRLKAIEVSEQAHLGTDRSSAHIEFRGHRYTLPPVRTQRYGLIHEYGDFDAHFGGLGLSKGMMDWYNQLNWAISRHHMAANSYNRHAVEKAKGGFFRRKSPLMLQVPELEYSEARTLFNRKLARARVAARLEPGPDGDDLVHPSSENGDLLGEMQAWARENWWGIDEQPWNNTPLVLPKITKKVVFTAEDEAQLHRAWRSYFDQ